MMYQLSEASMIAFELDMPIGIAIIKNGEIKYANSHLRKTHGNVDELMGMDHLDLAFNGDRDIIQRNVSVVLEKGNQLTFEYRFVSKDKEIGWFRETLQPVLYHRQPALLAYIEDITEFRRTEELLHRSEERLKKTIRSIPDPITITTMKDGKYIDINDAYVRLLGYTYEEAIGHTAVELSYWLRPEDREEMLRLLKEQGSISNMKVKFGTKSGETRFALESVETIELDGEQCLISVVHDITEQRRLELALKESEQFNTELLRESPNPIIVFKNDTSIDYVNPALEKLTEFHNMELIGKKRPYPWSTDGEIDTVQNTSGKIKNNKVLREDVLIKKKSGQLCWVTMSTVPVMIKGHIRYYLSNWTDITEEKRLKENMQFYIAQITRAQEEERRRIARELHDETVQSLAALYVNVHDLIMNDRTLSLKTKSRLEQLGDRVNCVLEELRRLSYHLRPELLEKLGLASSLGLLVEDLNHGDSLICKLELMGYEMRLPVDSEVFLFRIVQEALNNIRKHAMASEALVAVEFKDDRVRISISDNGVGFKVPKELGTLAHSGKLGIIGIQERTRLLQGTFHILSERNRGTVLTIELPNQPIY